MAMARTPRWVTAKAREASAVTVPAMTIRRGSAVAAADPEEAHQQPDREDDHRAEQEITEDPLDRAEAHGVDAQGKVTEPIDDVIGRHAERIQHDTENDRDHHELHQHSPRRAAEEPGDGRVFHSCLRDRKSYMARQPARSNTSGASRTRRRPLPLGGGGPFLLASLRA